MNKPHLLAPVSPVALAALFLVALLPLRVSADPDRPRIAVFSGTSATIQNTAPLVTGNKARRRHDLPLLRTPQGDAIAQDHLVPQRLAQPVEVFVEAFTAHPLEADAAELYAPPDGYLDAEGAFHPRATGPDDTPVYRVVLEPGDGLYPLPYMARQADGQAWDGDCTAPFAPAGQCRQPFFPDAARLFEEIDRGLYGVGEQGTAGVLSALAQFDFHRALPSAGYKQGLPGHLRTDTGDGDIEPETMGEDFFLYRPPHLRTPTRYFDLARIANAVQRALNRADYTGAIWLEGSPTIEETIYWLNLVIDTRLPIVGNAAQRTNRTVSADGPQNIVNAVEYITSGIWRAADGSDRIGAVMIQDEQILAARQAQKSDARPGGYTATGDHGGIIGTMGHPGGAQIYFLPEKKHTWQSEVRMSTLPRSATDAEGFLVEARMPRVFIVKAGYFHQAGSGSDPGDEVDILARIDQSREQDRLAGFVAEGLAPYGVLPRSMESALRIAVFSGMPVVFTGRGNAGGVTPTAYHSHLPAIAGNNLTATKARVLLIACLLKYGRLPPARDPGNPTAEEYAAVRELVGNYQEMFDTH